MTSINLCKSINCRFLSIGPGSQNGCTKFSAAAMCPVSLISGTSTTDYWITQIDTDERIPIAAAGCCPDPIVRLKALGKWPIEPLQRTKAIDALGDTSHALAIEAAIEELRIGPGSEE
jgi:hypothetical protein